MNYIMQGMTKMIPELFVMLKSTKVEIKKEHQVLMIDKTTSFKKRERKGTSSRMTSKLSLPRRSPKLNQSLKLGAYAAKEMVTGNGNTLTIWWIRRMANWTRVYLIYRLLMCTLLVFIVAPEYLILVRLLKISNSKQELQNKQRLVDGEVTYVCWKWFQDWYDHHCTLVILSGLVLNLNKCYLAFAFSMNMIWSCLLQYGYSFKVRE